MFKNQSELFPFSYLRLLLDLCSFSSCKAAHFKKGEKGLGIMESAERRRGLSSSQLSLCPGSTLLLPIHINHMSRLQNQHSPAEMEQSLSTNPWELLSRICSYQPDFKMGDSFSLVSHVQPVHLFLASPHL